MGLSGFGKGFAAGAKRGVDMMENASKMKKIKQERNRKGEGTMHQGKSGKPESRGADGATGAGAANDPQHKVRNLAGSKQKNTQKTKGGW